jgi:hypothetical protein
LGSCGSDFDSQRRAMAWTGRASRVFRIRVASSWRSSTPLTGALTSSRNWMIEYATDMVTVAAAPASSGTRASSVSAALSRTRPANQPTPTRMSDVTPSVCSSETSRNSPSPKPKDAPARPPHRRPMLVTASGARSAVPPAIGNWETNVICTIPSTTPKATMRAASVFTASRPGRW